MGIEKLTFTQEAVVRADPLWEKVKQQELYNEWFAIYDEVLDYIGKEYAIKSANNFRKLRKKGITIRKTADVIIATYCIENKIPLLFTDKDFIPFVDNLRLKSAI